MLCSQRTPMCRDVWSWCPISLVKSYLIWSFPIHPIFGNRSCLCLQNTKIDVYSWQPPSKCEERCESFLVSCLNPGALLIYFLVCSGTSNTITIWIFWATLILRTVFLESYVYFKTEKVPYTRQAVLKHDKKNVAETSDISHCLLGNLPYSLKKKIPPPPALLSKSAVAHHKALVVLVKVTVRRHWNAIAFDVDSHTYM